MRLGVGIFDPVLNRMAEYQPSEIRDQEPETGNHDAGGVSTIANRKSQTANSFGDYELLEELGRGGMGVVYRARQLSLNRLVALKTLLHGRFSDSAFVERFHTEAEAAAHLEHPNVVPIYEIGQHDGQHYYTMRLVESCNLAHELAAGPMPPKRAAQLIATLARAVHYAHQRGVLHRDLKPHNILLDAQGQPHLTDFGLAKLLEQDTEQRLSTAVVGSPAFMSPEQATGKTKHLTTAADVYGLGALLYAVLTGKPPFVADTPLEVMRKTIEEEAVPPSQVFRSTQREEAHSPKSEIRNPKSDVELATRHPSRVADLRGWEWRYLSGLCRSDEQYRLTQQSNAFVNLALAPDGKLLAVRQEAGNIELWDLATRQRTGTLTNQGWPLAMSFSPDGRFIASANRDASGKPVISFWDVTTRQIVRDLPQPAAVAALAFSPDGKRLATFHVELEPRLRLWQVPSGELVLDLPASGAINASMRIPLFSPDGTTLALGEMQGQIRLVDLTTGVINEIPGPMEGNGVNALAFSPDGRRLAAGYGYSDSTIRLWDVTTTNLVGSLEGHRGPVSKLMFAADGPPFTSDSRRLITASLTHPVTIWDVASATEIGQIPALGTNNYSVALSPDERLLAVGGWDGTLKVWDLQSQRLVKGGWQPHRLPVYRLCFLDRGKSLVSGALVPHQQVEVKRWDVASWREIPLGPIDLSMCYGIVQSPNQRFLALTYADKPIKVWDYASGRLEATLGSEGGWTPTFSPNGRLLAAAQGSLARVWEVASWRQLAVLEQPANGIFSVAFSPDGKRLVTGASVGGELQPAVRVWDCLVERDLIGLYTRGPWTGWTEFSPDGNTLLAVSYYGVADLYRAPSWEEIEAEERLNEQVGRQRNQTNPRKPRAAAGGQTRVCPVRCTPHWDQPPVAQVSQPARARWFRIGWMRFATRLQLGRWCSSMSTRTACSRASSPSTTRTFGSGRAPPCGPGSVPRPRVTATAVR